MSFISVCPEPYEGQIQGWPGCYYFHGFGISKIGTGSNICNGRKGRTVSIEEEAKKNALVRHIRNNPGKYTTNQEFDLVLMYTLVQNDGTFLLSL